MTLLSLAAAVLSSAVLAQTAPAPSLATYVHASKGATLVLITPAGEGRPKAVYYEGKQGRWLIDDAQLYGLGRDEGWAQIRYDIYYLQADGLAYMDDSYSSPSIRRWTEPDTVVWIESVAGKLSARGVKEAPLECLTRVSEAGKALGGAAATRSGMATGEKLDPGHILYPERLPAIQAEIDAARAARERAKTACETAAKEAFSGAPADKTAPLFYEALTQASKAEAVGEGAQRELDGLRIPNY